jgi:hypothetical protein
MMLHRLTDLSIGAPLTYDDGSFSSSFPDQKKERKKSVAVGAGELWIAR